MLPLAIVVAIAKNHVIGFQGQVAWDVPEDRRHFRDVTRGHAVILGRKTYEEINRPLPDRRNIVVSRRPGLVLTGCEVASSLYAAIELARMTDDEPRVIGGAQIYEEALPVATRIYLTEIDLEPAGDVWFELDRTGFVEIERRKGNDPRATYVTLVREPLTPR